MKLIDENGIEFNIVTIAKDLEDGDIIIKLKEHFKLEDIKTLEKHYTEKFGRKVIVVDNIVDEILTLRR